MKVNMTPNPLDVVTIHASQGDTEARQWEFELHNNGELINTSDITEQLFFKAYKGGTEQILPENTSTPTTSPFKGDIKYPQGLLSDQEFLYRESPTEEDGLAKITDIKGNTLVWNQLVRNGNFVNPGGWSAVKGSLSASNKILSYKVTELGGGGLQNRIIQNISIPANHKVFYNLNIKPPKAFSVIMDIGGEFIGKETTVPNTWNLCRGIRTLSSAMTDFKYGCPSNVGNMVVGDVIQFKNPMLIDLTLMFGAGNEPSTVDEFTSLFPLPYYAYESGKLLSFNGTGIKTVGFNLWDEETRNGYYNNDGVFVSQANTIANKNFIRVLPNTEYYCKSGNYHVSAWFYDANGNFITNQGGYLIDNRTFTTPSNCWLINICTPFNSGSTYNHDICINISNTESNGTYEPYTSSTLSLPISTYFPTGMKSAGNAYDELTDSKAIARIGQIDLGDLVWRYVPVNTRFEANMPSNYKKPTSVDNRGNMTCDRYPTNSNPLTGNAGNGITGYQNSNLVYVKDDSFTDVSAFTNAVTGSTLYYELATPVETSFTTASLVTENAEIPLSNEDSTLIGKCTEELSENPGFIDAKIKLADADGECYSNKIQLHVERSPQ